MFPISEFFMGIFYKALSYRDACFQISQSTMRVGLRKDFFL